MRQRHHPAPAQAVPLDATEAQAKAFAKATGIVHEGRVRSPGWREACEKAQRWAAKRKRKKQKQSRRRNRR